MNCTFMITGDIGGTFASHGNNHICIKFWKNGAVIASWACEGHLRTSFLLDGPPMNNVSLEEAINLVKRFDGAKNE